MRKQGYEMPSRCCVCVEEQDSMEHTLWKCNFSVKIWDWLCAIFTFPRPLSFSDICKAARNQSPLIKEVWVTAACATMRELWFQRNAIFFEEGRPNINTFKCKIYQVVHEGGGRMKGNRWGQDYDSRIITFFKLGTRYIKFTCIKECFWHPPKENYIQFRCDGASFGNPGNAGFGIIARDSNCQVIGTLSGGVRITTNFIAEIYAVLYALEWAVYLHLKKDIIRSDSKAIIILADNNRAPWYIRARWQAVIKQFEDVIFQHCYRKINFSADSLAKKDATLTAGERICHLGRPQTLKRIETPDTPYYRFARLLLILV
ncbi:uncharacterized protein LOC113360034 [Papaver somniferum]|uniref:uncharacterized protein LOC113360034 n=1 Tax=Papaver somniferum TaxID=3469 RepID=UPI000E702F27|nr:uncharacterized protein LOC113360034 [Papaver somniferum]